MTFNAVESLSIRTFCTDELPGSLQMLHLFCSKSQAKIAFETTQVTDSVDHGFIYLDSPSSAWVTWRNKAGEIQFCGSGAYALAWLLGKDNPNCKIQIHTDRHTLIAETENQLCYLTIPAIQPEEIVCAKLLAKALVKASERLFVDRRSGIYLLQLASMDKLEDKAWLDRIMEQLSLHDIHGFCAFYWDNTAGKGMLRYFVPWHGRDEDYVTGSIQQYLTSLVYRRYGTELQYWTQCSSSAGSLTSEYRQDDYTVEGISPALDTQAIVRLSGHCNLVSI